MSGEPLRTSPSFSRGSRRGRIRGGIPDERVLVAIGNRLVVGSVAVCIERNGVWLGNERTRVLGAPHLRLAYLRACLARIRR